VDVTIAYFGGVPGRVGCAPLPILNFFRHGSRIHTKT
jgi:hypothetical protein